MNVYIISHNRSSNVKLIQPQLIGLNPIWCVGYGEGQSYTDAGANQVIETGALIESRNKAIDHAQANIEDCIMIDDDLDKIETPTSKNNRDNKQITFPEAIGLMYNGLKETGNRSYLIGVAPTPNAFYFNPNKIYSFSNFIGSWLMIIIHGCPLRFDPQFKTKEDYDYTLQHYFKYGNVLRCNNILAHFKHYGNKGGVVDIRTEEIEQDSINKLKRKWGHCIQDNKKRKNEILLRISY